jgi:hypothetical protein
MQRPPDFDSPALAEIDRQIGEADAERIVLEASDHPGKAEVERARKKLAELYDRHHRLLHQPDNPEDVL